MAGLPDNVAVETVCHVDAKGARTLPVGEIALPYRGLVQAVKAHESLTVQAAVTRSRDVALQALLAPPAWSATSISPSRCWTTSLRRMASTTTRERMTMTLAERLGYGPQDRLLIVNCDDVGSSHAANLACHEAMTSGVATSGTLMVPCAWAREAVPADG